MSHFQKFGRFEIVRKLSRSLTDVYLARDSETDRLVVLKLIEQSRDEFTGIVIEAERRGAILQKQLHRADPRILEVFDFGDQQNCFFVAMEYFEGRTLAEVLREESALEPARAARYAAEIADQLKTLHSFVSDVDGRRTAVVHGDIKPSNIQLGVNGQIKLLDFGIAKVITLTRNLTHHNLGSPSYCSPERLSKGEVDPQADLWALGVSLYELLSGVPPYQAENTRRLENLIQSRCPLPPLPASCSAPLRAIVSKALAPDLERRYPTAADFGNDLLAFLAGRPCVAQAESNPLPQGRPTVRRPQPASRAARLINRTRTILSRPLSVAALHPSNLRTIGLSLTIGFLFGFFVLLPIAYFYRFYQTSAPLRGQRDYATASAGSISADWALYNRLQRRNRFLKKLSPVMPLAGLMHARFVAAADSMIDGLRKDPARSLRDYNWPRAQLCLRHALDLDPSDSKSKGKLALCSAYSSLLRNPKLPKAAGSLAQLQEAARLLPSSPDPHLALARLYIYSYRNVAPALTELQIAQKLGYRLGPREAEEQGDGYLTRGEWELVRARSTIPDDARRNWLALAQSDIDHAEDLYGSAAGRANIDHKLQRLSRARAERLKLAAEPVAGLSIAQKILTHLLSFQWQ